MTWLTLSKHRQGFTLLEVVIAIFILGTVVAGMFGLFLITVRGAQTGERRIVAVALANERMEMVRNLPYLQVGTVGGIPAGAIPQETTITRNGQAYVVKTDIRYVDDDYDGSVEGSEENEEKITICHMPQTVTQQTLEVAAPALGAHLAHGDTTGACGSQGEGTPAGDEYNADYKKVRVEVSWPSQYDVSSVLLITYVTPHGVEGSEEGGTLDFHAFDTTGAAVEGATLVLTNTALEPDISITTQTNAEGRAVLPGLPPETDSYHITITKDGYTQEQTYDPAPGFIPHAEYSPFSVIVKEVILKAFFIDRVSGVSITTQDDAGTPNPIPNVAYSLRGSKTIGEDGMGNPVYKVNRTGQTNATGQDSHDDLDWDTYTFSVGTVVNNYDIKETSAVLPFSLVPGAALDLRVTLVPHTPVSLHVTVVDGVGAPVENATVHLTGTEVDEMSVTGAVGQVFFPDLPAAGSYMVAVEAPGFTPLAEPQNVTGTTRITVPLVPITP